MEKKKRDVGLDITRIVAFASVVSVHFFLNTGFYDIPVANFKMYIMVILRNCFTICVPLFMLLTGYLFSDNDFVSDKEFRKHFFKLKKVLLTYVLAIVFIILYRTFILGDKISARDSALKILAYPYYSWYVNQYIGLFLLIPFFNILWKGLISKKQRLYLVIVLIVLTVLPSVFNVYNLGSLRRIINTDSDYNRIIPDFWVSIYPITYYFIGASLKKDFDIKKCSPLFLCALLIISFIFFGIYNIVRSYNVCFVNGIWCSWGGLQNTINSILLFLFINSFRFDKVPIFVEKVLALISDLTFGAYLLSYISDDILYHKSNEISVEFKNFPVNVGKSIIISLILSLIIYLTIKGINCFFNSLIKKSS